MLSTILTRHRYLIYLFKKKRKFCGILCNNLVQFRKKFTGNTVAPPPPSKVTPLNYLTRFQMHSYFKIQVNCQPQERSPLFNATFSLQNGMALGDYCIQISNLLGEFFFLVFHLIKPPQLKQKFIGNTCSYKNSYSFTSMWYIIWK